MVCRAGGRCYIAERALRRRPGARWVDAASRGALWMESPWRSFWVGVLGRVGSYRERKVRKVVLSAKLIEENMRYIERLLSPTKLTPRYHILIAASELESLNNLTSTGHVTAAWLS